MTGCFRYEVAEGVATILWDLPGASMNVLTLDGVQELETLVERAIEDPAVRGVVIGSAKRDFAGGMDLGVLAGLGAGGARAAERLFGFVMRLHALLRRIERGGAGPDRPAKPFAWAAPGTALGIGLELGLACHRRFAADAAGAKIGLPEVLVGLFPGAGGTTRLARMLGPMAAAPFLLEGRTPDPKGALAAGLIDAVVPPGDLLAAAQGWAREAGPDAAVKPWDRKGFRLPGGAPYTPQGFPVFLGAAAMTHGRSKGVYPAVQAMLSAVYEGALVDIDTALRIEARWFVKVLLDPSSGAMIRTLFLGKQALDKGAGRPAGHPEAPVERLGVLGGGMMGAGIAHAALAAGIAVRMVERDAAGAARGRAAVEALLADDARAGRPVADGAAERFEAGADYGALAGCDLVIEAVFEDPAVKAEAIARAAAAAGHGAVIATNTSTLPVAGLAEACPDPARFLGVHFFSPVRRMALVEAIRGPRTGDAAVAKALDLVRALRKTPIVVNDARFFYANRCILPYLDEGMRMVVEGAAPALVENAARMLGMPVGPLQLVDETSLELGLSIARATRAALGAAHQPSPGDALLAEMVEGHDRRGRKNGRGFYDYDARGKRAGLWPGLAALRPPAAVQPPVAQVQDRLLWIQTVEAVRALEEGVLGSPRDGDVAAILGWGFAPWTGGPFSWIDRIGAREAVARCAALEAGHGARFAAPRSLRDMAARGARFHADPAATAA